jgi:hypothetical protein
LFTRDVNHWVVVLGAKEHRPPQRGVSRFSQLTPFESVNAKT